MEKNIKLKEAKEEKKKEKAENDIFFATDVVQYFTKYYLNDENTKSEDVLMSMALFTWNENIKSRDDLLEKYNNFIKLSETRLLQMLFSKVIRIHDSKYTIKRDIEAAINIYYALITDDDFMELCDKAGYHLPSDFEDSANYLNSTLYRKVLFFNEFKNNLIEKVYIKKGGKNR